MKLLKRSLCLLLALLTAVTFIACKKDDEGSGTVGESVNAGDYEIDFSDKNYEGHEFKVLRVDAETQHGIAGHPNDIYIEQMGEDSLANTVYQRNQELSRMLNVNISMSMDKNGPQTVNLLSTNVLSGDDCYDLVIQELEFFPSLVNQGLIKDMKELSLDTSYSWWDRAAENSLRFEDKQYGMISDAIYLDKLSTVGVFYNTVMAEKLHLPNIYEMVEKGEWTYEKMKEYAVMATESGEDIYGISCQNDASYYFLHSANIKTVIRNTAGELKYNLANNRAVNTLGEIFTLMNLNYFFNRQSEGLDVDSTVKMFDMQTLFLVRPLQTFYYIKNYNDTYGILPMPKFDDVVTDYYSAINHHVATFIAVPANNSANERTADVLQAWSMISNKIVMPELYDRILSTRMVSDLNSSKMIDIILKNRVYDIGFIWNFGSIESTLVLSNKVAIERAPTTIGSVVATAKTAVENSIKSYTEKIN